MIFSLLVGYAIGVAIGVAIVELFFTISSYWNSRNEIREKAKNQVDKPINYLEVFVKNSSTYEDEEELEIKAYDYDNNHVANIKVTATNGTSLRVGERF